MPRVPCRARFRRAFDRVHAPPALVTRFVRSALLALAAAMAAPAGAEDRHWSFRPPVAEPAPPVRDAFWPSGDIDRFVLAGLEARGLAPGADAEPLVLLRRVCLELTGLPPSPDEVRAFLADTAPGAFERVVDRLLASPRHAERQARRWLDVARYAESTGKTVNFAYPHAWRYRDWVIDAFDADMPYDEFVRAQLAGDLLPAADPAEAASRAIATGFLALGPKALNERSGLTFELDMADEQVDVTTQAFLGLTVACARCHDHKADPIPQADYAALVGIFRSTETLYGTVTFINARRPAALLELAPGSVPPGADPQSPEERERVRRRLEATRSGMARLADPLQQFFASGQVSLLEARLDAFAEDGTPKARAMGVRDKPPGPPPPRRSNRRPGPGGYTYDGSPTIDDSPVYDRGEADSPAGAPVPRGAPPALACGTLEIPPGASGRRELAEWIVSRENPLAARVMVNRVWLWLFGRGLVPTPEDFGIGGRPPTHPQLLDTLAVGFMDDGWSVKRLVRRIVTSRTWRLSSAALPEALAIDPDGESMWRAVPRRLDAETLHDAILAVSGRLDPRPPRGSAVAEAGEGPVGQTRRGGDPLGRALDDPERVHRAIYLPVIRDLPQPFLAAFDGADPSLVTVARQSTTVPTQALHILNDPFVLRAADAAAARSVAEADGGDKDARIRAVFLRVLARPAAEDDVARARAFLDAWRARDGDRADDAGALAALCQVLLAGPEFQWRR
ncbi:MAG: DUF1549 and DUF1553 domain-containing protein [Planctomycetaceae bacterium]